MNVIGPFPLYATLNPIYSQILHVRSMWNSFKMFTVSLSAEEIANESLKQILSRFSVLPLKPFRFPRCIILFTHDLTRSYLHSAWVTHDAWRRKGRGMFVPKSSGEQVFTMAINTPLPSLLHLLRSVAVSRSSSPQTLAPPLLHRRRWGRASLPRPRRRRTRADCGNLHSAAAVAVSLCQVRAWEI